MKCFMHTDQPTCSQLFPELLRGKANFLISNSHYAESGGENTGSNLKNRIITVEKGKVEEGRREAVEGKITPAEEDGEKCK